MFSAGSARAGWLFRQNKEKHGQEKYKCFEKNEICFEIHGERLDNAMTEWNKGVGRESDAASQLARAYISEAPLPC